MHRGKLVAVRRGAVVVLVLLGLCTAGQAVSPSRAQAQLCTSNCPSLASTFNNVCITTTGTTTASNCDGSGYSFSRGSLTAAGISAGSTVSVAGPPAISFTWPSATEGQYDNTVALGQTINMTGEGVLGFLVAGTQTYQGGIYGDAIAHYTDGDADTFRLQAYDWCGVGGVTAAITTSGRNHFQSGSNVFGGACNAQVFYFGFTLRSGKALESVTLPNLGTPPSGALHIFAVATSMPGPPTNLTATPGDTTATISWTAPPPNPNVTVTGYTATAYLNGQPVASCTPTPPTGTSCVIEGLTNGETYTVTVVTIATTGNSPPSSPVTVTPTGELMITVPDSADLGSAPPGGTAGGPLGTVTVTDDRGAGPGVGSWMVTVSATPFTDGTHEIPLSQVHYWSGPVGITSGTLTVHQETAAQAVSLQGATTAVALTGGDGLNSAQWNPTVSVTVPITGTVTGTYTATIYHSVY